MREIISAGLVVAACFVASGCDTGCTEEGCHDGVEIWFASSLDASLEFSVSVQADTEQIQCDFAKGKALDSCASKGVWVQSSGSQVDGFLLKGYHPQQVTFAFSASGNVLVSATVSPSYVTQQPNGPECPPTCKNAKVNL
jgi:hypothetical protein